MQKKFMSFNLNNNDLKGIAEIVLLVISLAYLYHGTSDQTISKTIFLLAGYVVGSEIVDRISNINNKQ